MIYTVTLNPAFDRTIICSDFRPGQLNRIEQSSVQIGGKGINVAKVLRILGEKSTSLGFLGARNAGIFLDELNQLQLPHDFILIENQMTRTNYKVIDPAQNSLTELNENGFTLSYGDERVLLDKISGKLQATDYIVFSGSVPQGSNVVFLQNLITIAKMRTQNVILDLSGENLRQGIAQKPLMIKPNKSELEEILGGRLIGEDALIAAGLELLSEGIPYILISLGAEGSYFFTDRAENLKGAERAVYKIEPLKVRARNPVGAGDSQVAAFVFGLVRRLPILEILSWTAAVSAAMVARGDEAVPGMDEIYRNFDQIKIRKVN